MKSIFKLLEREAPPQKSVTVVTLQLEAPPKKVHQNRGVGTAAKFLLDPAGAVCNCRCCLVS